MRIADALIEASLIRTVLPENLIKWLNRLAPRTLLRIWRNARDKAYLAGAYYWRDVKREAWIAMCVVAHNAKIAEVKHAKEPHREVR